MGRLGDGLTAGPSRPCVTCGEWLAWLLVDVWHERDVKDWPGARAGAGGDRGGPPAGKAAGERRDKPAWRRDMRTSCIEGVAIHGDLGSCAGVPEGASEA